MIEVKLSPEDAVVLREILVDYLSDLRMEISATDLMDFRENLKHRERVLNRVVDQLPEDSGDEGGS